MTKKISIVSPCFNEQVDLISCYETVRLTYLRVNFPHMIMSIYS